MTAFIRSFCLAALLAAGTAWAQQSQTDNPDNPHSTKAKDKQGSGASSSATNQQVQQAETANPHSTDNRKDASKPSGQANTEAGQEQNPHNPDERFHREPGQGQMAGMDHDAMMKNATPQMMLQKLHMSNQHEIEMAKMAQQNGSDRIKSYADTLARDHQDADQKVKDLAKKKSITLSDTPKDPQMQQKMEMGKEHFAGLKGDQFDRAFTNRMSMEHRKMISLAQSWRQNCNDQDVCNLIDTLLPKLQQHEQTANSLRGPAAQGRAPETTPR